MAGYGDGCGNWSGNDGSGARPAGGNWWRWVYRREWQGWGPCRRSVAHGGITVVTKALSNAYWQKQGLRSIAERYHQLRDT